MRNKQAIVIGAGIVGLATARALALKGFDVKVFDRNHRAVGASIRNFGMIWPIGQPAGKLYSRAIRTREIWREICVEAGLWHDPCGSLHLAYHADEMQVLTEVKDALVNEDRNISVLDKEQIVQKYELVNSVNLLGGLYSAEEMIVDPREVIGKVPAYFSEKYNVQFYWGKCVSRVNDYTVCIGNDERHQADAIFICSGSDFETLYPETFSNMPITKCKLQMMRLAAQQGDQRMGVALCGGLSLIHYANFKTAASLHHLADRFQKEMSNYIKWGIHVMVSQNESGQLTVGDSHECGSTPDPFDRQFINQMILDYLGQFAAVKDRSVIESWNGIYSKLTNGATEIVMSPEKGVTIINGLGGAGMTLSFGLAEEVVNAL